MANEKPYGKAFRDALKCHSVKLAGTAAIVGTALVGHAAAATEDFGFINDTLQGVGVAILGVLPMVGDIVTVGGPIVVKTAVYICIAAPFVALAYYLHKQI